MFNENKFKPDQKIMHDWFSDAVTRGLNSVGITQEVRDQAQPVIDSAKNLLPGGAVRAPGSDIGSIPQPTGFNVQFEMTPGKVAMILGGVIVLALVIRGK